MSGHHDQCANQRSTTAASLASVESVESLGSRDFTHPGGTFAPSPSTLPERPLTGLQVVQVLKRKRGLLNAWMDCNLWSAGSPHRRSAIVKSRQPYHPN